MAKAIVRASVVGAVLLCVALSLCSAQAPGDEADRCTTDHSNPPVYPDNERTLMDSYSYVNLLPGNGTGQPPEDDAVWNDMSYDGNDVDGTLNPTYWQQGAGGICRYQVRVCGYRQNGDIVIQNNWLFTQHISKDFDPDKYNYPVNIHVRLTYAGQSCRPRNGCDNRFYLTHYVTNDTQLPSTEGSGYMNTDNYPENVTITPVQTSVTYTHVFSFITLKSNETGFYLAVHEHGNCLGISRMTVFRYNCQGFRTGLVVYPDAPAPFSDSVNINVACVDNAVFSGSDQVTCDINGTWGPENPECECKPGYDDRETECVACPVGEYRSATEPTCKPCPGNTLTDVDAAAFCECELDHFRDNIDRRDPVAAELGLGGDGTESFSDACTKPPSAPQNVTVIPYQTSITVHWTRPVDEGGRTDLYYQLQISNPEELGSYEKPVYRNGNAIWHTFTGLRPYTQYCIQIIAHNGVSDQDPSGVQNRMAEVCITTLEAPPGVVSNLQVIYPAVIWQPPERPNGVITGYKLIFTSDISGEAPVAIEVENGQTHFVIEKDTLPPNWGNFIVQVVAVNRAGEGQVSCGLKVNPNINTIQRCTLCQEQTVGLVHYPSTDAPEQGSVTVTTECVENAVLTSQSLSVTCNSSGVWGSENPQCECMYAELDANTCEGPPGECRSCPGGITVAITDDCSDVYILWSPVEGARQYSLRLSHNGDLITTVEVQDNTVYKISLSDPQFKDKVISVEIGSVLDSLQDIEGYSDPIEVDTEGLVDTCKGTSDASEYNPVHIGATFIATLTFSAVVFTIIALICLLCCKKKASGKFSVRNNDFFDSPQKEEKF